MRIGVTFDNPWALALIPVLAAFIIITGRKLYFSTKARKRAIIALRIMLVLCLSMALASPGIRTTLKQTGTVFIADVSDSMNRNSSILQFFIEDSLKHASRRDITGIISFAADAVVVKMPDDSRKSLPLNTRIRTEGTDIENALTLAHSIMPENTAKRLVLLTDGKETSGNAVEKAKLLSRLGYTIDVAPFPGNIGYEVQIEEFNAPKQVNSKERYDISVKINSTVDTKAVIRLYQNRTLAQEKEVELYRGENLFTFSDTAEEGGIVTYTAEVVAESDTVFQNNEMSTFTQVLDQPRILLVEKDSGGENLVRFIEEYAQIIRVKPGEVPVTMQEIFKYDAFILVDISYDWLNEDFVTLLEQAVKNQGKGLLVTGGENSYAPGWYFDTPLETVLPVNMDISDKSESPGLGLVLVIDKSGSMTDGAFGISKLELAKEAAIRTVKLLDENDQLGVIAFDDAVQWVIRTEPVTDKNEAIDMIGSIRPEGGTQILHPLEAAWQDLRNRDAKLKHIILLTDGQAEKQGYERIIYGLNADGITLSTVAVGKEADTLLLKALAYGGKGRYYHTDEFSDIPTIFAKETFLAGQKYLQNRHFYPELASSMGLLKGIEAVPPLDGYVATRIKPSARMVFKSDTEDPVLAVWQYGLGRTAAWTSDIQGVWTSQWSMWQDAPLFWGNLVSWMVQKNINTGYSVNTAVKDGKGVITLTFETGDFPQVDSIEGVIVSPDGTSSDIELHVKAPGVYEGEIDKNEPGAYIINLNAAGTTINTGIAMPYHDEYRVLGDSENFLNKLAKAGGGRIITEPDEVFSGSVQNTGGKRNITNLFIILSLVLLLIDIAFRKLQLSFKPLSDFYNRKMAPAISRIAGNLVPERKTVFSPAAKETVNEPGAERAAATAGAGTGTEPGKEDRKGKEKKEPGKKQVPEEQDHISALLNRRKKWK
ncbi:MAG: VWA domain-containing protein [Clostridiaceae bacterium]|nr:VWA domain-containing protein [Clostridiaceae bacterium]